MVFYHIPLGPLPPRCGLFPRKRSFSFGSKSRDFPSLHFGTPPPRNGTKMFIAFYSQLLKRAPVVLYLGALSGPGENPPLPPPLEM